MADLNFAGSYDGLHLPYSPEAEQAVYVEKNLPFVVA